ncbi:MAG: class I SAM-dependent methyltransferase [Thermomicrobiales bacterium]
MKDSIQDQMTTAATMLAGGWAALPATGDVLVIGGEAALPRTIRAMRPQARVVWIATDVREVSLQDDADIDCRQELFSPLGDNERFEAVLLPGCPDRALTRRWLLLGQRALAPNGVLLLAGANGEGIRALIADAAALFGPAVREDYRQKHRIARFIRDDATTGHPAWAVSPGIAPATWQTVTIPMRGESLSLATLPGVFSGDRLDAGTALLLGHLGEAVAPGARVLDVGCGAGAIGFAALALGAGHVDMSDVNLLAVASVRETIREQGIADARALAGDVYDAVGSERYDLIVSNPPFHQGKTIDYDMPERLIGEAAAHLRPGGSLLIVANAFLAYERLMNRHFHDVQTIASTRQYRVLRASRPR